MDEHGNTAIGANGPELLVTFEVVGRHSPAAWVRDEHLHRLSTDAVGVGEAGRCQAACHEDMGTDGRGLA